MTIWSVIFLMLFVASEAYHIWYRIRSIKAFKALNTILQNEKDRADFAENKLAAVDVRDSHYPALQAVNASFNAVILGMRTRLATSDVAPFGKWTGKFERVEDLILFLIFDVDRDEVDKAIGRRKE